MAAAWMNVVYGFGGMRSDGDLLVFNPSIPAKWKSFSFRVLYRDSILSVAVDKGSVALKTTRGPAVPVKVFGRRLMVGASGKTVELPADRRG
jgi:maltose phosphorylase